MNYMYIDVPNVILHMTWDMDFYVQLCLLPKSVNTTFTHRIVETGDSFVVTSLL